MIWSEVASEPYGRRVLLFWPFHLDTIAFNFQHVLGGAPTEPALRAPSKDRVHIRFHPRHAAGIRRIAGAPGHAIFALGCLPSQLALAHGIVHGLEGGVARNFCADGGGADAGVQAIGLLGDCNVGGGEEGLELGLVSRRLADGVDVDLADVDTQFVDATDQSDCCIHGLRVEVVGANGPKHISGDVPSGQGGSGPAAGVVEVGARGAESLHEPGADGRGEDLGIVEAMGVAEQRIGQRQGQEEDAVDHGPEDGAAAGLVNSENAGRRGGRICRVGREEGGRYGREVRVGGAREEGVVVDGGRDRNSRALRTRAPSSCSPLLIRLSPGRRDRAIAASTPAASLIYFGNPKLRAQILPWHLAHGAAAKTLSQRRSMSSVFAADTDKRDEYGMQPLDSIFSSPQKAPAPASRQDDSGSEDMDIASSSGPGPRTLLKGQRNIQYPIPRSRSPAKTHLMSPARRPPHMIRSSSPTRGSIGGDEDREPTVTRRLDYPARNGPKGTVPRRTNGVPRVREVEPTTDEEEDVDVNDLLENSLRMIDGMDDVELPSDEPSEEDVVPAVKPTQSAKKGRGRPKKASLQASQRSDDPEPLEGNSIGGISEIHSDDNPKTTQRKRGRPPKKERPPAEPEPAQPSSLKRRPQRNSLGSEESQEQVEAPVEEPEVERARPTKKPRTQGPANTKAPKPNPAPAKAEVALAPKPKGRPKKTAKAEETGEAEAGEASFVALQRGPPMPKSRGLVSVRRDPHAVTKTRSGRTSYQPLHWWRGEEVVQDVEEQDDAFYRDEFVVSSVKEVLRVPEEEVPSKRTARSRPRSARPKIKSKQRRAMLQDDEEPEDWELNEGTVTGEVVIWEREYENHPPGDDEPVHITEDQIAISADAIRTSQTRDSTFRFAKTLTMPFLHSGIVDLAPGAEKLPKNSRKMHMVFFVHYGKVLVTVNEAQFRISAGGMWFVPRGNYYSISNDYESPCRIFFAQACEVSAQAFEDGAPEAGQSMMSMA
ncbi:Inner kinetochore subunit cnp3 [Paramyrothecium foliicola]|nr:Inner kinetochore subunit cnp3 [Paramyrothecium foliicola]